jgi:hypothetical protein
MTERTYSVRALLPFWVVSTIGRLLFLAAPTWGEEAKASVEPAAQWSNVFGGKEVEIPFVVRGAESLGQATWSLTVGPRQLSGAASYDPAKPAHFSVKVRTPDVKPGVILKLVLTVTARSDRGDPLASCDKVLWVFPADPFADRAKWLESLKITLFDPAGATGPFLKKAGIPFKETANVAELAAKTDGLALVGAGASFVDYPDLWPALTKLAGRGVPVLCLAPAAGELPLPGADAANGPEAIVFHKAGFIKQLDRRLDADGWAPDGKAAVNGVSLKSEDGQVAAAVGKDGGWPWIEIDYPAPGGALVICGFDFLSKGKWEAGPTPRYLFARLLTVLKEKSESEAIEKGGDER